MFSKQEDSETGEEFKKQSTLQRWNSVKVMGKTISGQISAAIGSSVESVRSRTGGSVRAPAQSRSTLRGVKGTWSKASGAAAAGAGASKDSVKGSLRGVSAVSSAAAAQPPPKNDATHMFGIALEELMERQAHMSAGNDAVKGMCIPLVINKLVEHLMVRGTKTEGILRLAGAHNETDSIKQKLNAGSCVDLYNINVHVIGDLLKSFVRDLPGSLFDGAKWDRWMVIAEVEPLNARAQQCKDMLLALDRHRRALITVLFGLLKELTRNHKYTRMDCANVAKVFAPNVLIPSTEKFDPVLQLTCIPKVTALVETMLQSYDSVFKELKLQYFLVRTINFKSAVAARGPSKLRGSLRSAPAPPPPTAAAAVAPAQPKAENQLKEQNGAKISKEKRRRSEEVLGGKKIKQQPQQLQRAHTMLSMKGNVTGSVNNKNAVEDENSLTPNSPLKRTKT